MAVLAGRFGSVPMFFVDGRPAVSASATIKNLDNSTATLYTDKTKATTATNPVTTSATGTLTFYATPGEYLVVIGTNTVQVAVGLHPDEVLSGGGGGSLTIQNQGSNLPSHPALNFGTGLTATENTGQNRVDVTAAAVSAYNRVAAGGSNLTQRGTINIIGGIAADDSTNQRTNITIPGPNAFTVKATNPGAGQLYLTGLNDSPMDGVTLLNGDLVYYRHDGIPGDSGIYVVNSTGNWSRWGGMAVGAVMPSGLLIHIQQGISKGGKTYITRAHSGANTYTIATYPSGEIIDIDELPTGNPLGQTTKSTTSGPNPNFFQLGPDGGFSRLVLTGDTVVAFMEPPDDSFREYQILIEQDSTGGRNVLWSPRTIAWSNGMEPVPDTAPLSVTWLRLVWLGTAYGLYGEAYVGVPRYIRLLPAVINGVTLGLNMYAMRGTSQASINAAVAVLNRWTTQSHRARLGANGLNLYYSDGFATDPPLQANLRGFWEFYGGFTANGSVLRGNPMTYQDGTIHEYFHGEHNYYFPAPGFTDPGGTSGSTNFTPYATSQAAIGYTNPALILNHPIVQDAWHRAYSPTSTRTLTGCTLTSGSPIVTLATGQMFGYSGDTSGNTDISNFNHSNGITGIPGAGLTGAGVPAATTRTVNSCTTYSGFPWIVVPNGSFTTADLGSTITGTAGIPAGAGIVDFTPAGQSLPWAPNTTLANDVITMNRLATASGSSNITVTDTPGIASVQSATQFTMNTNASSNQSGVSLTLTAPSSAGNRSALGEWYAQMRSAKKVAAAGDSAFTSSELAVAGNDSTAMGEFEDLITHAAILGG